MNKTKSSFFFVHRTSVTMKFEEGHVDAYRLQHIIVYRLQHTIVVSSDSVYLCYTILLSSQIEI